ncbi:PHP domain-containing protein [Paenibacillus sp. TRM 82003]|nr:PHP domain-containing protein [Paenibacillus sp. TRM 82003]
MMVIDFHTHTKLSKKVNFTMDYFRRMVKAARGNGLTALALTEHFNTTNFADIYDQLDRELPYRGDYYDVDGFRVFPGMEIDIRETGHNLVIGRRDDIRELRDRFRDRTTKDNFPSFEELFDALQSYDVLKIGAHPTRISTPLTQLGDRRLRMYDAFDLNGKDLAKQKDTEKRVYALAASLGKPVVGGSDAHLPVQLGAVRNVFRDDCRTIGELKEAIASGRYSTSVSPAVRWKVYSAEVMKRVAKRVQGF